MPLLCPRSLFNRVKVCICIKLPSCTYTLLFRLVEALANTSAPYVIFPWKMQGNSRTHFIVRLVTPAVFSSGICSRSPLFQYVIVSRIATKKASTWHPPHTSLKFYSNTNLTNYYKSCYSVIKKMSNTFVRLVCVRYLSFTQPLAR